MGDEEAKDCGVLNDSCERPIRIRSNDQVVVELGCERREIKASLKSLKRVIELDPENVSTYQKELWKKQAEFMEGYVDILGKRIVDLINNKEEGE